MIKKLRLGDLLIKLNLISESGLELAQEFQAANKVDLAEALIRLNSISKNQLVPVLEYQTNAKYIDLYTYAIDKMAANLITEKVAREHRLIPVGRQGSKLQVAMADPLDFVAQDDIRLITGMELEVFLSMNDEIERSINMNYTMSEVAEQAMEDFEEETKEAPGETEAENEEVLRAPVVRLVNSILEQATRAKASDIHIEPFEKQVKIRLRIDGDLREILAAPKTALSAIVARIKILSSLDISEKRIPQDGRIETLVLGRRIDFRVSILPTVHGEKVVMRILDRSNVLVTKQQLGFTSHNLGLFDKLLKSPEGIILVSGPTGSGKSTTLYAALNEMNQPNRNIVTVEDPVEYQFHGISQVQVNARAGLTFANGLRSILRQDPDIIMLGEIRDAETAEIAVRSAITGHLVLSTIHTNDAVSTIMRLADMGIETYLVLSALVGVVAQRLVKKLCVSCKRQREATSEEKQILGVEGNFMIYEGKGCNACGGSGYLGRIAIHEILVMDSEIRAMFTGAHEIQEIEARAIQKGMKTLAQSAKDLIFEGITSVSEMLRVSYSVES